MAMTHLRDHGLGQYGTPDGPPVVEELLTEPLRGERPVCPACGCEALASIVVRLKEITFPGVPPGHVGVGRYLGCPACPWASPMAIVSQLVQKKEGS